MTTLRVEAPAYKTIVTICEGPNCRVMIEQVDRPGTKRRYCGDTCRQRAHRRRKRGANAGPDLFLPGVQ